MEVREGGVTYVRVNPPAPFTNAEKARRFAMVAAAALAIAACVGVLAGYGGKEATSSLALEHSKSVPIFHKKTQSLDDEGIKMPDMPAMPDMSNVEMPKVEVPDPAETTRKAQEAMAKATGAAGEAISAAEDAVKAILPEGFDFIHALVSLLCLCLHRNEITNAFL
jgi:hypothetical protein